MPFCRDIGPNASARFQSLSSAYAGLHVHPGGGDAGLEPSTTFVNDNTDWARYQHGRSFDISALNDPETRRCLLSALGYIENPATPASSLSPLHRDLRTTLEMIDYFRHNDDPNNPSSGGNRADPNDPNDHGDANVVTQFEIEQYLWNAARSQPEATRWTVLRDRGDETMRHLHAILGLAQFLTTPAAPVQTAAPAVPPPENVTTSYGWYDPRGFSGGTWASIGGIVAVAGLATFLGFRWGRRPGEARADAADAARLEADRLRVEAETRIGELTEQANAARDALQTAPAMEAPRLESLRQELEARTQELQRAQTEFDRLNQEVAGKKRPSASLRGRQRAAEERVTTLQGEVTTLETQLRGHEALARAHGFLGSR